jgi:iron complex transport system permease protein
MGRLQSLSLWWRSLRLEHSSHFGKVMAILCLGLCLLVAISLSLGPVPLSLEQIEQALWRQGDSINQTIVWDLRLPRTLAAILVGAALGMAGMLMQGLLRNGLADPFILGISAGAGLVAIAMITFGVLVAWVPVAAWLGAIATSLIVYGLGRTANGIVTERLILGGVAISSLFGAIQAALLLLAEDGRLQTALNWLIGSLNGRGWTEVNAVFPYLLTAILCGSLMGRSLNVLNLGDEAAMGLGISLTRSRLAIGGIASLLAASAVSMSGLIGFVGLIVPHGVRLLVGSDYRLCLPLSAIAGAIVLTFADLLARIGTVELPVGVVTALLGSPLFIWLLYSRNSSLKGI